MNELAKAFEEATRRLVKKYVLATEKLTEEQLADAIRQAIEAGDFQRWVVCGGTQQVVYLPFSMEQRRAHQVKALLDLIERINAEADWVLHFPVDCQGRIKDMCRRAKEVVGQPTENS